MWPRFNVLYTVINKYPTFSDTALTTCKNIKPHHRILQCEGIQHVGGRDIAFKWSSLLENLKSGVRDEGDTAQHSTWGSSGTVCVYIGVGGWVGLHFFHTSHAWIKYLAHCHSYIKGINDKHVVMLSRDRWEDLRTRWANVVQKDARQLLEIRGWRSKAENRDEWRRLMREAKARKGL